MALGRQFDRPGVAGNPRRAGFTAFEALLATAILAMIAITLGTTLNAGRQQSYVAQKTTYASLVGRALMDEILRYPYGNQTNAPDNNEYHRSFVNSITGYNGFSDGPNNIKDVSGTLYPTEYQELSRSVSVTATTLTPTGWTTGVSGVIVKVTVSINGQPLVTLSRFVSSS
jgi:hypothetical protein